MKKLLFIAMMCFVSVSAFASVANDGIKTIPKLATNKKFELLRITGSYVSDCGVKWNFVINTNNPFSVAGRLNALIDKSNKACGTAKTQITNFIEYRLDETNERESLELVSEPELIFQP
ncbi:hypothetical protein ACFOG5_21960 [Pedobacter fastidiosus]|uniref:Uncharacterized protein n=1 Tax=Pedobacter fastidiosus TaxID=2765361 RepID=A0ABR7KNH1_9SPHI|nr:hypothetical protein [Pedobacter fastidiosus]MBC6109591.1 hypothetical protein [Pedobacter fastidiosus]